MMSEKNKPFLVGKLCYAPWNIEHPWHIVRYGEIIDQGGSHFGSELIEFKYLEHALDYLEAATERDLSSIDTAIKSIQEEQSEALPYDE